MSHYAQEVDYTPERWRKIGLLAKHMRIKYGSEPWMNSHYRYFGSEERAKRYSRLLCWVLGFKYQEIEIHNPNNGHIRSVCFRLSDYQDNSGGIYIDSD